MEAPLFLSVASFPKPDNPTIRDKSSNKLFPAKKWQKDGVIVLDKLSKTINTELGDEHKILKVRFKIIFFAQT